MKAVSTVKSRGLKRVVFASSAATVLLGVVLVLVAAAIAPTRRITSAIDIAAPPGRVWEVLTDLPAYPTWNPTIAALVGKLEPGSTVENVEGTGEDRMVFWPRVLTVAPERELAWRGRLRGLPLLFVATHDFRLEPIPTGTRFVQSEKFTGVLLWWFDVRSLLPGFTVVNVALAKRAQVIRAAAPSNRS